MAKVLVTRKTFSKYILENVIGKQQGIESMFLRALINKDDLEKHFENIPDEEQVWVDTDKICVVSQPIIEKTTQESVFSIEFQYFADENNKKMWIKGDEYDDFLKAWKGE